MRDDWYDNEWVPEPAKELEEAAQCLEEFNSDLPPRTAFLLAKWLRSYAAEITEKAREDRATPEVDVNALILAEHIKGEGK